MKKLVLFACTFFLIAVTIAQLGNSLIQPVVYAATNDGNPTDTNIRYIGRWDTSSQTVATSYYGGAYLKTKFTGTTVKVKLGGSVNMHVSIDNGNDVYYAGANGIVNLTPSPLNNGEHSIRIAAQSEWDQIQFEGLLLDPGASTLAPTLSPRLIEFVGDSITAGLTSSKSALTDYAWIAGEELSTEHTQIAFSGICLVDQCSSSTDVGMSSQFFKERTVLFPGSPDWNFNRYQPDAVVINLGTNDNSRVTSAQFEQAYVTFLQNIRQKYPQTQIIVLSTFLGLLVAPTQAAVQYVQQQGDNNVHYIDTTGWITYGPDYNDGAHPSDAGHSKIAQRLIPILDAYLSGNPVPTPSSSLPAPWQTQDVGSVASVGVNGSASYSNATFTVSGSGSDIWGTSDAFHYAYQPLNGNGTIIARVTQQQNTNEWAKAGIMIRENLALGSMHALLALTPSHGAVFQYRANEGGNSSNIAGPAVTAPYWLKLVRENTTFTGYTSHNGTDWSQVGSTTIPMAKQVFIGLAVTAHNNAVLNTSTFDQVTIPSSVTTQTYQAESALLSNGAQVNTNHVGYQGTGFVDGYWNIGATTSFQVSLSSSGSYSTKLRYANARGTTQTLNLYVNNTFIKTVYLPTLLNWDTWSEHTETLVLNSGTNTIRYTCDSTNTGNVNLDALSLTKTQ